MGYNYNVNRFTVVKWPSVITDNFKAVFDTSCLRILPKDHCKYVNFKSDIKTSLFYENKLILAVLARNMI